MRNRCCKGQHLDRNLWSNAGGNHVVSVASGIAGGLTVINGGVGGDGILLGLALQAEEKILAVGSSCPTTPGPSLYVLLTLHMP